MPYKFLKKNANIQKKEKLCQELKMPLLREHVEKRF